MLSIKIGITISLLAVVIGAFGAHGLKEILTQNKSLDIFQTAVRYQMFHSIAIIITGILIYLNVVDSKLPTYLFLAGIIIFSGSLYILSITDIKWLGAITPIGGVLFILGWGLLFVEINF
ncbi:MAG: hypothetical protein CMF96_02195 [Candidatus Marinimicrobia bacterium]|nr:hypothetical protein [Candidatus Neomarinimicrobiota bacterium]